jgi:hypothetical protein
VNGDQRPDVVAVTEDSVVWFANPTWEKRIILKGGTARDNVCIQAHDIDGDGRVDFALGAGWKPPDTGSGGTLQWLTRGREGEMWHVHPIAAEPSLHRIRWGDVVGSGYAQLVVGPLQGRGTKGPNWGEGPGVRLLVFTIPADPANDLWPSEVADRSLHTTHNFQVVDLDQDGRNEILVAAWEGVFALKRTAGGQWTRKQIGTGNQQAQPSKGASEIKLGRLKGSRPYIATIEPWHGYQVVVYTEPTDHAALWTRRVIDEPVSWGHAVWCADVDRDGDDELIIGQRDPNPPTTSAPRGPGVWLYDPKLTAESLEFEKHIIDDGGIGTEDLVTADLDRDDRPDIVAGGRSTHNVRIYWNRAGK